MTKKRDTQELEPTYTGDEDNTLSEVQDQIESEPEKLTSDEYQKLLDELRPTELAKPVDPENDDDMTLAVKQSSFTQAFERMLVNQGDIIRVIRTQTPNDVGHALSLINMFNAVNEYLGLLAEQVIIAKTERGMRGGEKY